MFGWTSTYADELSLTLIYPALTEIPLVYTRDGDQGATYFSQHPENEVDEVLESRVQVTFDDAAPYMVGSVNDGYPIIGVFQPVSPLSALNGETAAGTWSLRVSDDDPGAAQCYYGAVLNIVTDGEIAPVAPTVPAKVETAAQ